MIENGRTYVVMGLLSPRSLAHAIGRTIESFGGRVLYTVQNERLRDKYLDPSVGDALDYRLCDLTHDDEVAAVFDEAGDVAGVVHSAAFANPKTCLGTEFHTEAVDDVKLSMEVSCISLATVARHAQRAIKDGGSIVALSFDTRHVYPAYNWMNVSKAALEALVRALARRHGRDRIRVNAVSAGPLATTAGDRIPGFEDLVEIWQGSSPLPWHIETSRQDVAYAVAYLLGPYSAAITGEIIHADGGATTIGGRLLPHESRDP